MTRFSVELDEVRALARNLNGVHERLAQVMAVMSALGGSETGHRPLAAALEEFAEDWKYSLGKISEHAEGLEGMLAQAAETYRAVDAEAARAARG